jgi:hypothetical protein
MNRLLLFVFVLSGAMFAGVPPKTMTKIEVILQSPMPQPEALRRSRGCSIAPEINIVASRKHRTPTKGFMG